MSEQELRELFAAAKAGRVSRRAVMRRLVGLGLSAPFAGLLLSRAGLVSARATRWRVVHDLRLLRVFAVLGDGCGWRCRGSGGC